MTKDTATIREVYQLVEKMRDEMQEMEKRLSNQFQKSMDVHCQWATATVSHYELVASDYNKRIINIEKLIERASGILAVFGLIVPAIITILTNFIEKVLAKGN
jgi:hypothetical protein